MPEGRGNAGRRWAAACCALLMAAAPAAADAQGKGRKQAKPRIEHLACRLGTEDRHARIAVELVDGKVRRFAYYSKWKPRTCSIEVERDDAFSQWADFGGTITVTLIEEKGAFLIDQDRGRYHFIFRDVDRMRYCGMEGKINGSLTLWKGNPQCALQGVMDEES
ncbi:MAG TPA: hypothetical protein VNK67_01545 [Burkholderiales bacterium]|nr:hypothetical protein [Burkholderiales bacterium]